MSIDTQYVGGKIQLTFTFDAKEDGKDMAFAKAAKTATQQASGDFRPDGDEHLMNPDLRHALDEKCKVMKALANAFNSVLRCGAAHVDATTAVSLANGGEA